MSLPNSQGSRISCLHLWRKGCIRVATMLKRKEMSKHFLASTLTFCVWLSRYFVTLPYCLRLPYSCPGKASRMSLKYTMCIFIFLPSVTTPKSNHTHSIVPSLTAPAFKERTSLLVPQHSSQRQEGMFWMKKQKTKETSRAPVRSYNIGSLQGVEKPFPLP